VRLRVGTRGSRLARTQTGQVCDALCAGHVRGVGAGLTCEPVIVETTGDRVRDRALREIGGKGLFVKELDEALLDGRVDCAVHSAKDVPTELPDGIVLAAVPVRHRPHDLLISLAGLTLERMPAGAVVGTASPRRAAQAAAANRGLRVELLRGNVETRLRRIREGEFDATFLAAAGIDRLGLDLAPAVPVELDPLSFVPAPGQGALCFTARADDRATLEMLAAIDDRTSRQAVEAERSAARELGGSCFVPVGCYARVEAGSLELVAVVTAPDGQSVVRRSGRSTPDDGARLGARLGRELLEAGGAEIVASAVAQP